MPVGSKRGIYDQGGVTPLPPFDFGNALTFNGVNQRVEVTDRFNNSPQLSGDFALSLWFEPGDASRQEVLVGMITSASDRITKLNATQIQIRAGGELITYDFSTMVSGTWYHMVFNRDAGTMRAYLNGVESTTGGQPSSVTYEPSVYGAREGGSIPFLGALDDIYIWPSALTTLQIATLYNGGNGNFAPAVKPGHIQGNPMDEEGDDRLAADNSGNNRTLILLNYTGDPWRPHFETPFEKYIRLAGIADDTAYQTLLTNLQIGPVNMTDSWSDLLLILPFPIDSLDSCRFNFKDVDKNVGVINGGLTHGSGGTKGNQVDGSISTNFEPSAELATNNASLVMSVVEQINENAYDAGCSVASNLLAFRRNGPQIGYAGTTSAQVDTPRNEAVFVLSRLSNIDVKLYEDGAEVDSSTTENTFDQPPNDITIFALNNNGTIGNFGSSKINFFAAGNGLSAAQVEDVTQSIKIFRRDVEPLGNALTVSTDAWVDMAAPFTVPVSGTWTLAWWALSDEINKMWFGSSSAQRFFQIGTGGINCNEGTAQVTIGNSDINDGRWHQITLSCTAGIVQGYLDGAPWGLAVDFNTLSNDFVFDWILRYATIYVNGRIDEVGFLDGVAASETQAGDLFANGDFAVVMGGADRHYKFDQIGGTNVPDTGSDAADGTVSGTTFKWLPHG